MNIALENDFDDAKTGLLRGDFSRLEPLFHRNGEEQCAIVQWFETGKFEKELAALAEAFTCACFNGCDDVVKYFLARGVDASGGFATGMNAFHWAANRGQLGVVKLLVGKAPLETKNMYGGTVLDCTVWSAIHEPKTEHLSIIKALLEAGADVRAVDYPSGDERIDQLLRAAMDGAENL